MRKILPYIIGFIIAFQSTLPPLEFDIQLINDPVKFVWAYLLIGVLAIYFIFSNANVYLKIIIPYLYINSFLSSGPHSSMVTVVWAVICAYFYLLCLQVEDWRPVFRIVRSILILEIFLLILKFYNKETLLNFGKGSTMCAGSVGNIMQLKSLMIILVAFGLQGIKKISKYLKYVYAGLFIFAVWYFFAFDVLAKFNYARGSVWIEAIKLTLNNNSIIGYGIGTFKWLFCVLGHGRFELEGNWTTAHNVFIEMFFEGGIIGLLPLIAGITHLLWRSHNTLRLGVILILFTLMFYFPVQQESTCIILFAFLAYSERRIKYG